ncbi:unnamed protein product [Rotaria sordida]|uniref:Glycolipid transfer protein domain-containing protein n=1 Tax=Rotaria sordida TaxID=392033 RepID=A0A819FFQ9_9BILA|nr:unnamed protein product [Rotaria sordida]
MYRSEIYSDNFSNNSSIEKIKEYQLNDINEFNVYRVYDTFIASLRESNNSESPIGTQDYIDGYRELIKFCDSLGYIFKFVKDDVIDKLNILQLFVDKDIENFDTIQKAINYETEYNLIKTNPNNFTRTLLRLHRALLFIIEFLHGLAERPLSESTTTIATQCYDATLNNYHTIKYKTNIHNRTILDAFLIRKSVKIGFRILPSRLQIDEAIFHGHKTELLEQYKTFIKIIQQIYDTIQTFYTEKKYLQLP